MACSSKTKLLDDIECEGFDYALTGYDDYSDIPDEHFQELYKQYLKARSELVSFLGLEGKV